MSGSVTNFIPKSARGVAAAIGAAAALFALSAPAEAATGYRALCAGDYCFNVSTFIKSRSTSGAGLWDIYYYITYGKLRPTHYNIRFRDASGRETQIEVPAGAIRSFGVKPGKVYVISSQACTRSFLSSSQCTNWRTTRFTGPKAEA
jgi:hypothetical protein